MDLLISSELIADKTSTKLFLFLYLNQFFRDYVKIITALIFLILLLFFILVFIEFMILRIKN